jgi:hypothetical protein
MRRATAPAKAFQSKADLASDIDGLIADRLQADGEFERDRLPAGLAVAQGHFLPVKPLAQSLGLELIQCCIKGPFRHFGKRQPAKCLRKDFNTPRAFITR